MSTPTYPEFISAYPEMNLIPESAAQNALDASNLMMLPTYWGDKYALACGLLAAHNLALRFTDQVTMGRREQGMNVAFLDPALIATSKSASVGGLSEGATLAPFAQSTDPFTYGLSRTEYGLELLTLMQMWLPPGFVVRSPDTSEALGGRNMIYFDKMG
jgi:hypothetical protein